MPAPVVYVVAALGAVGAAFAFKEFVYEPVIAPRVERWAAEFLAKREAKRQRRLEEPVAVPLRQRKLGHRRRRSDSVSSDTSESDDDDDHQKKSVRLGDSVEMNELVSSEVREWRTQVHRSSGSQLRLRRPNARSTSNSAALIEEPTQPIPYTPLSPSLVHVIIDPNDPSTPTSTATSSTFPSRVSTPPPPQLSPLRSTTTTHQSSSASSGASVPSLRGSSPQSWVTSSIVSSTTLERTPSPRASLNRASSATTIQQPFLPAAQGPLANVTADVIANSPNDDSLSSTPNSGATGLGINYPSFRACSTSPVSYPLQQQTQSLSEIYPQELEAERGVEFLSPPSSRSESPFFEVSPSASPLQTSRNTASPRIQGSLSNYQSFSSHPSSPDVVASRPEMSALSSPSLANFASPPTRTDSPWISTSPAVSTAVPSAAAASSPNPKTPTSPVSPGSPGSFYRAHQPNSPRPSSPFSTFGSPRSAGDQFEYPASPGASPRLNPFSSIRSNPRSPERAEAIIPPVDYPRSPSSGTSLSDLDFMSDFDERRSESDRSDGSWAF